MTEAEKDLVFDVALNRVSEKEFLRKFPVDPRKDTEYVSRALVQAGLRKDRDQVECAILLGYKFGFSSSCVPVVCQLILEDWHREHENMASMFQHCLPDPRAVDSLFKTANTQVEYLDFDEAYALAVKCIWSLYTIGTPEAREKLALLAQSPDEIIAGNAQRRLADVDD